MWKHAKNSMKELKRPNSVFYAGYVRSSLLKTPKTCKTRETKTRITQNFPIVWLIQGSTMSKSMPRAFQKCGTFRYSKVLNQSYWPPKSGQIRGKQAPKAGGCARAPCLISWQNLTVLRLDPTWIIDFWVTWSHWNQWDLWSHLDQWDQWSQ